MAKTTMKTLEKRIHVLEELAETAPDPDTVPTCPECGRDLTDVDVLAHRDEHWGDECPDPRHYKEAARRYGLLTEMI